MRLPGLLVVLGAAIAAAPVPSGASALPVPADHDTVMVRAIQAASAGPAIEDSAHACGLSPQARQLAELIRHHPLQHRVRLVCHPLLAAVAAAKAREMAERGEVTHIYGVMAPNRRLRKAGYRLPQQYPGTFHNQVEAVAGGYSSAEEALQAFLDSTPHRTHLLAEHPFYAEQDEIAVGYARNPNSDHIDYWVVFIARRADSGNPPVMQSADRSTPSKSP